MMRRPFGFTLLASALLGVPLASCSAQAPSNPPDRTEAPKVTTRGLDPAQLARTIEQARQLPRLRSLVILRHGETLVEQRFNGGPPLDHAVNIKSASKTILSAVTGIAINREVLTGTEQPNPADSPAGRTFRSGSPTCPSDLGPSAFDARRSGTNVRGILWPLGVEPELGTLCAVAPLRRRTGRPDAVSHLLSAALTKASGRTTQQLAQDWLGTLLGIRTAPWPRDPQGIYFGGLTTC